MTEKQLQQLVIELAGWRCLFVYHTHDSRRSPAGFPDLVIVGRRGLLFAELKSDTGRMSSQQFDWMHALLQAGQRYYLWRPADWESGKIRRVLEGIA